MLSYPIGTPGSNALIGLAEVVFSVADPTASAGRLAKFTGRSAIETETGMSVPLDRGKLTFFEPKDVPRSCQLNEGRSELNV